MKERLRKRKIISFLLSLVMVIGLLPNMQVSAAIDDKAFQWDFTGVASWDYSDSSNWKNGGENTGLSLSAVEPFLEDGTAAKGNKVSADGKSAGVQFRTDEIGLSNSSKIAPAFDVSVPAVVGKDVVVEFDWKGTKNPGAAPDNRINKLIVAQKVTDTTWQDMTKDNWPLSHNASNEPADSGHERVVIPKEQNVNSEFRLRICAVDLNGGGNRPGFILDNLKITFADQPKETKVGEVIADPASSSVKVGTTINFRTRTTESAIHVNLNGEGWTTSSAITLEENDFKGDPEKATIETYATKEGLEDSEYITYEYTKKSIIPILDARALGKGEVIVEGTVTRAIQSSATNKTSCTLYIQDDTAGIAVFKSGIALDTYPIGTKVRISGSLSEFKGVLQLAPPSLDKIEKLSDTVEPRTPAVVTIDQLNTKNYEGNLVKIEGVRLSEIGTTSNHTIVDDNTNGSTAMRCSETPTLPVDKFIQNDYIDVIGIASNNNGPAQILVSKVDDIIKGKAPTVLPVVATPGNNGTVPLMGKVILTTKTPDVKIQYTLNGSAPVEINSNTAEVVIQGFDQDGKATIKAKAIAADGSYTTPEKTFIYTQAKVSTVKSSLQNASVKPNSKVELSTTPENAEIYYVLTTKVGTANEKVSAETKYTTPIILKEEILPVKIKTYAKAGNYLPSDPVEFNYKLALAGEPKNYFGQLHSHTAENSDGAGTLVEAYDWARDHAKLDFFAVTDHSNAFDLANKEDKAGTYNLGDYNKNNVKWQNGKKAAADALRDNFVSIYAYEMTWSGGPGHMNTFGTDGFVSRNNAELNNKANNAGLRAYYALLKQHPESISQFNHPGETFGTFSNFGYYDPQIDERISLVEVGNGEGAVGSGGYFKSYNEYNKALDKGWHLAPTNNQDNHKKEWGTANTARTVIYTNDLSVSGLYSALREMRVYATEDNNLDIVYTVNDNPLGTIVNDVPQKATFNATINDPDGSDKVSSVSIISNGGKAIYTQNFNTQNADLKYDIENPKAGYYYLKVVQNDGDIAVTAPVWLGKAQAVGISEVKTNVIMPVTTEELTITTELFNNENAAATVKSISYDLEDGANIATDSSSAVIAAQGNYTHTQKFTPSKVGKNIVNVTAVVEVNGMEQTFTNEIELNVRDIDKLIFVGVDASHFNEYVSGNYKDSMGNFAKLAANYNVRLVELRTSQDLMSALSSPKYQMMVFTAPSRRDGTTGRVPYATYSDEEISRIANFAKSGKKVIIAGWADFYENYANVKNDGLDMHMAGQQNKLLQAIGSSLRISDDGALDDKNNGGQAPRLYLKDYNNFVSPYTKGIVDGQVYSSYGGATIYAVDEKGAPAKTLPASVTPVISGHETTYSKDQDSDGFGLLDKTTTIPKYNDRVLLTATEDVTHSDGTKSEVIVAGAAFMSNFEIQATVENAGTLNYSNYNILENIIATINPIQISNIADVKTAAVGTEFTIEGIATSGVYNGTDDNKGFFDCIYAQDETGGINLFPVSQGVEAGQKIRVTGTVSGYQGETQLKVSKIQVVDPTINPIEPVKVSTGEAMSPENTGKLIKVTGRVKDIVSDQGVVGQITINDGTGPALIYINGYITKNKDLSDVKIGKEISAIGLASIGENFQSKTEFLPRIRVRDRSEIIITKNAPSSGGSYNNDVVADNGKINETNAEKAVNALSKDDKATIAQKAKEETPYTNMGATLTIEQLAKLTNNKFTKEQLAEMIKNPKLLESLGIDSKRVTGITLTQGKEKEFNDIPQNYWAHNSIQELVKKGIVAGTSETTFSPNEKLKVSDTFTFLDRVLLLNGVTDMKLPRSIVEKYVTDKENWAFAHVASVSSKTSEKTLKAIKDLGEKPVTRELLAQVLYEITDGKLQKIPVQKVFSDVNGSVYKDALSYCIETGLLKGTGKDTMSPQKELTRAELIAVLQRLDEKLTVIKK